MAIFCGHPHQVSTQQAAGWEMTIPGYYCRETRIEEEDFLQAYTSKWSLEPIVIAIFFHQKSSASEKIFLMTFYLVLQSVFIHLRCKMLHLAMELWLNVHLQPDQVFNGYLNRQQQAQVTATSDLWSWQWTLLSQSSSSHFPSDLQ